MTTGGCLRNCKSRIMERLRVWIRIYADAATNSERVAIPYISVRGRSDYCFVQRDLFSANDVNSSLTFKLPSKIGDHDLPTEKVRFVLQILVVEWSSGSEKCV